MKLSRLEAHDRLQHFIADQSANIWKGADDCLKKNPDSLRLQDKSPYIYIFAHPRTAEDGVTKRMLWQPRLTKPKAQTNSYLFRAQSHSDVVEVFWLIPPEETWSQYKKGNVTENPVVEWSIHQYLHNREKLEAPEPDDLSYEQVKNIMLSILNEMKFEKKSEILEPT